MGFGILYDFLMFLHLRLHFEKSSNIPEKQIWKKKNSSTRFGQFKVPQASGMTNPSLIYGYASKVLVVVIGRQ